jgi:hypothetical protein
MAMNLRNILVPNVRIPRWRRAVAALFVVTLVLTACASPASPAPDQPGRAAVILIGSDRTVEQTCVDLQASEVTGRELLERAGIAMTLDERNPMGALVCAIGGQGCAYPAEDCLCRCQGLGDCAYWASFVRTPPGTWTYAGQGVSAQRLHDGDLYAWVWLPTAASRDALDWLPEGGLDSLCP